MDKYFQNEADSVLSEHHSRLVANFRKENDSALALNQSISSKRELITTLLSKAQLDIINNIFELMIMQSYAESKYLYVCGAKDCIGLSHFLDSDFVNSRLSEFVQADNANDSDNLESEDKN